MGLRLRKGTPQLQHWRQARDGPMHIISANLNKRGAALTLPTKDCRPPLAPGRRNSSATTNEARLAELTFVPIRGRIRLLMHASCYRVSCCLAVALHFLCPQNRTVGHTHATIALVLQRDAHRWMRRVPLSEPFNGSLRSMVCCSSSSGRQCASPLLDTEYEPAQNRSP